MPVKGAKGRESGWLRMAEICRALDLSQAVWIRDWRPKVAPKYLREVKSHHGPKHLEFYCRGVLDDWHNRGIEEAVRAASPDAELQTAPDGKEPPLLARLRLANARMREHDLAVARKEFASVAEIRPVFTRIGATLRRAGDKMQKAGATEAYTWMMDAIRDAETTIAELTKSDAPQ